MSVNYVTVEMGGTDPDWALRAAEMLPPAVAACLLGVLVEERACRHGVAAFGVPSTTPYALRALERRGLAVPRTLGSGCCRRRYWWLTGAGNAIAARLEDLRAKEGI